LQNARPGVKRPQNNPRIILCAVPTPGARDCHIEPDWVLIYAIVGDELRLLRTGNHADLFKK